MKLTLRLMNHRNRLARFYDAGESQFDRFTAVYLAPDCIDEQGIKWFSYRAASVNPFAPNGFGIISQCCGLALDALEIASLGKKNHLGKRVSFLDLPKDVQSLVISDLSC